MDAKQNTVFTKLDDLIDFIRGNTYAEDTIICIFPDKTTCKFEEGECTDE